MHQKVLNRSPRAKEYNYQNENKLEGCNSSLDKAEDKSMSGEQGSETHPNRATKKKKRILKGTDSIRDLRINI